MRKHNTNAKPVSEEQLKLLKANAYDILTDVRKTMLQRFPFVGAIAMNLDIVPTRDIDNPTAAVDGAALYFDINFLAELKPEERIFVFAHEIYHCVMMHALRLEKRNPYTFNIASDIEVNQLLEKDGLVAPKDGCFILSKNHPNGYDFKPDLSAEEYYELLMKDTQHQTQNSKRAENDMPSSGNYDGKLDGQFDRHIMKDEDRSSEYETTREGESDKYGKLEHDPDFRPNLTHGNIEHIREAAITAAQMLERQNGKLPEHIKKIVNNLTEPKVDWKEVLSQFVTRCCGEGNCSWNRPNSRFVSSGIYLPSHEKKSMNIAIVMDTSCSVSNMLSQFLGELNGLVKSFGDYKLTVIQNDCAVQDVVTYSDENPLDLENVKFHVKGFGGTDLTPAFNYIADNALDADCVVAMTDGMFADIASDVCELPTLWLVTKNGTKKHITFGEVLDYT